MMMMMKMGSKDDKKVPPGVEDNYKIILPQIQDKTMKIVYVGDFVFFTDKIN